MVDSLTVRKKMADGSNQLAQHLNMLICELKAKLTAMIKTKQNKTKPNKTRLNKTKLAVRVSILKRLKKSQGSIS